MTQTSAHEVRGVKSFAPYGSILRRPLVAAALGTSVLGRLHESMISFGVIMLVTQKGSYAQAGIVMAAFGAGGIVAGPVNSRLADRYGHVPVLLATAVVYATAVLAMAVVGGDLVQLSVVGALAGLCTPPLTPALRSTLPSLVAREQRLTAFALESTLQEVIFVAGPVLAGAVAVLAGPQAALVGAASAALAGTVGYCLVVRGRSPRSATGQADGVAGVPEQGSGRAEMVEVRAAEARASGGRLLTWVVVRILLGGVGFLVILSIAAVAIIAQVSGTRAQGSAGLYLALMSGGSMLGGLVFGVRVQLTSSLRARYGALGAALVVLAVVAATGAGRAGPLIGAVVLGSAVFLYGTAIAPVATVLFGRLSEEVGERRSTEAFGWLGAAMGIGGVVGDASGGWLVTVSDPWVGVLVASGVAFVTTVLVPATPHPYAAPEHAVGCDGPTPPSEPQAAGEWATRH